VAGEAFATSRLPPVVQVYYAPRPMMRDVGHPRLATVLFVAALSTTAHANDEVRAGALAREAEKLLADGKTEAACDKLRESVELDPRSTTALDLGLCRDKQKRIGSAYRAFALAEDLANKEKRSDRATTARDKKNKLAFRVPKLTVKVADETRALDGLVIRIDGEVLPAELYGKPWEVDAGELTIEAAAPGRKPFTTKLQIAERARKDLSVPALAVEDAPPPTPTAPAPEESGEENDDLPHAPVKTSPEVPEERASDEHEEGRLVVEIGAYGGFLFSDIARGSLSDLTGAAYVFQASPQTELVASCGSDRVPGAGSCEAFFAAVPGALVGGQAFVGWAVTPRFHLGLRFFGAARFPEGFFLAGGLGLSGRAAGPLWLGAGVLAGTSQHVAGLERAEGSVPPEYQAQNGNQSRVPIPLDTLGFTEGEVDAGLLLGGHLELSLALVGASPHALLPIGDARDLFSGALMLSVWPTLMGFTDGFVFAAPGGLSYRFH
jgi:hypothetical protein